MVQGLRARLQLVTNCTQNRRNSKHPADRLSSAWLARGPRYKGVPGTRQPQETPCALRSAARPSRTPCAAPRCVCPPRPPSSVAIRPGPLPSSTPWSRAWPPGWPGVGCARATAWRCWRATRTGLPPCALRWRGWARCWCRSTSCSRPTRWPTSCVMRAPARWPPTAAWLNWRVPPQPWILRCRTSSGCPPRTPASPHRAWPASTNWRPAPTPCPK